jgi:hypothetical protein
LAPVPSIAQLCSPLPNRHLLRQLAALLPQRRLLAAQAVQVHLRHLTHLDLNKAEISNLLNELPK